jgi:hypothetical protein
MSTRATYQINNTTFYCHWDGYPTGAAQRFAAMIGAMTVACPDKERRATQQIEDRRGGYEYAFIRGALDAEPTEGHSAHGDTEYQYTLKGGYEGATIRVDMVDHEWAKGTETKRQIFCGDLRDWLDQMREQLLGRLCDHKGKYGYDGDPEADAVESIPCIVRVVERNDWRKTDHVTYATIDNARLIAHALEQYGESFNEDNPNRKGYLDRAAVWYKAIAEVSVNLVAA